jgi:hypothetical protein
VSDAGSGSGILRLCREIPLLFGEKCLKTGCFDSLILNKCCSAIVHSRRTFISFVAVKIALLFMSACVFSFVTAAASESDKLSDQAIRALIPGGWISQEVQDGRPMTLTVEYRSDGTMGAFARMTEGRYRINLVLSGTWRVHNGILVSHTEGTGMRARVTTHEIVAINETMLVLRDRDGGIVVKRRAPAKKPIVNKSGTMN